MKLISLLVSSNMNKSLLGALHLVDFISFHIQFGLERHLLSRPVQNHVNLKEIAKFAGN